MPLYLKICFTTVVLNLQLHYFLILKDYLKKVWQDYWLIKFYIIISANINEFDSIVFHTFGFNEDTEVPDQTERKSHQRYVMFLKESPLMDWNDYSHFNDFFNWTATYRWDSDFVFSYGWISPGVNFTNILRAAFLYWDLGFVLFWRNNIGAKAARNMLEKLNPGFNFTNILRGAAS